MTPLLRRQLVVVPLSVLFGFLLASVGFRNGLDRTVFGSPYDLGGGYNALGRVGPFINLPHQQDRKDTMVLASSFGELNIDWVDGSSDRRGSEDVSLLSQDQKARSEQSEGSWRAHINAVRSTVEQGLFSAMILEDDLDWDIRLREQMHTPTYADSSFPDPSLSNKVTEIPFVGHPATLQPSNSAYGDDWDVLWLGHCGMQMPTQRTPNLSKGRVVFTPDPFVVAQDTITIDNKEPNAYPNQTRVFHHTYAPSCSLAYAVSQRGARRILYEASQRNGTEEFDGLLRELCDGGADSETKLVCVTTQPSLFSRWRDGRSEHVRWSVRMNMEKYVRGDEREWIDQYPG
ncbi:hypothetical protein SLS60_011707 [Paraconiothyrium brasiliense]|uniref:Glycosyltransferase family 25 protein n=1 Tax=Paraconiothyrium brasiliense TaxID=300254 RepID=A0ABR3QID1_9PLEO